MGVCCDALGVSLSETAPAADLGGSSTYSNESFEDRSEKGFMCQELWFKQRDTSQTKHDVVVPGSGPQGVVLHRRCTDE